MFKLAHINIESDGKDIHTTINRKKKMIISFKYQLWTFTL